jgi:FAD/FMN-containing dehydrogenase
VAITMKIVTALQIKFAVRSGGHSPTPGFASVGKSGILLDLNALDQTTLSLDQDIAHVEPGTTWDKVYEQLEKQKLTVVGGRVAGVGVGGLITGGLPTPFMNRHPVDLRITKAIK